MFKVFIVFFSLLVCSCGTSRSVVKVMNNADGTETTVSITAGDGGSTSVSVSPVVNYNQVGNNQNVDYGTDMYDAF